MYFPALCILNISLFYRMERALQLQNPDLAIPYWDTTLDRHIPDPRESVMFSEHLFGNIFEEVNKLAVDR